MQQLVLELAHSPQPTLDNFVVGDNAELMATLMALASGTATEHFVYLWGGLGSGRTHLLAALAQAWQSAGLSVHCFGAESPPRAALVSDGAAVCVDDVESMSDQDQIELFNIFNKLRDSSGFMVVTGGVPPASLSVRPDVLSRLAWGLVYEVRWLNEADRQSAVVEYAQARGLTLSPEVLAYLLLRTPRDLNALRLMVDRLDRLSLAQRRAITVPLVRTLLRSI